MSKYKRISPINLWGELHECADCREQQADDLDEHDDRTAVALAGLALPRAAVDAGIALA
ncbi:MULTISPECIES: hypothetical protein [Halobacterium]|uniref:hypothetical protein n=1 Tax=Halobacterium TaxID=2239 RepID=UPI0012F9DEB5|nr:MULTISPECIES: hypothetical protein [Halobacterium]MCG1003652.1 hypothetical protein [Halobacterium noricense]